jgi:dihydrofolate reductase
MHVTLATVASLDGRLTRGEDPNVHAWSSVEDWHHFVELRNNSQVLVMDREAYEQIKPEPEKDLLRVVMTHHPELYKDKFVKGRLEFVHPDPSALIADLKRRRLSRVLIAGDTSITYDFLQDELVDDLYVTLEPILFGVGAPFMAGPRELNVVILLKDVKQLNEHGTLLCHYSVLK